MRNKLRRHLITSPALLLLALLWSSAHGGNARHTGVQGLPVDPIKMSRVKEGISGQKLVTPASVDSLSRSGAETTITVPRQTSVDVVKGWTISPDLVKPIADKRTVFVKLENGAGWLELREPNSVHVIELSVAGTADHRA